MLEGKTAIVTGGTSGIGRAIAAECVGRGADVVVTGLNEERGQEAAEEVGCEFRRNDVRDYDAVEDLVDSVAQDRDGLDIIVNNAGVASSSKLGEMDLEEWRDTLDTNLNGVMHGTKAALPHLLESEGSVVNVSSIYGLRGGMGAAAYSTSKGGVVNFTQQVAVDYASEGVRVNGICPGFVWTSMTEDILKTDEFYDFVRSRTPMGRAAEPEEIAPLAAFLASDGASYITGVNVPVDGGWTSF